MNTKNTLQKYFILFIWAGMNHLFKQNEAWNKLRMSVGKSFQIDGPTQLIANIVVFIRAVLSRKFLIGWYGKDELIIHSFGIFLYRLFKSRGTPDYSNWHCIGEALQATTSEGLAQGLYVAR